MGSGVGRSGQSQIKINNRKSKINSVHGFWGREGRGNQKSKSNIKTKFRAWALECDGRGNQTSTSNIKHKTINSGHGFCGGRVGNIKNKIKHLKPKSIPGMGSGVGRSGQSNINANNKHTAIPGSVSGGGRLGKSHNIKKLRHIKHSGHWFWGGTVGGTTSTHQTSTIKSGHRFWGCESGKSKIKITNQNTDIISVRAWVLGRGGRGHHKSKSKIKHQTSIPCIGSVFNYD